VVDHSAGEFSLNSLIDRADVYVRPDNVHDLGHNLLSARHLFGDIDIWLFQVRRIASLSSAAHAPTFGKSNKSSHTMGFVELIGATTSEDVRLGNFGARS